MNMGLKADFGGKLAFSTFDVVFQTGPLGGAVSSSSMFIKNMRKPLWPMFVDIKLNFLVFRRHLKWL